MAQRRMFHSNIVESDRFLDLPPGAQLLYFHLGMHADDDGFVNGPKQICRKLKRPPRELRQLIQEEFLYDFDGIVVIRHFRIANRLKADRSKPFIYPDIARRLYITPSREYSLEPQENYENLFFSREALLASKWTPSIAEGNQTQPNQTEDSLAEGRVADEPEDRLQYLGGTLGQNVILISNQQMEDLIDRMGLDAFDHYAKRLSDFIINKQAHVANHYETILKWYNDDKGVRA